MTKYLSQYMQRICNPYRRPNTMKEKHEELQKWKRLSKTRRKSGLKTVRKPASAKPSSVIISRHKKKEKDEPSKYLLPKRLRHWKRRTKPSRYKKRPRTKTSRY